MTSNATALSAWTAGVRQPLGLLFLISAVCFNLAYLFLPPTHSIKRRFDRMYINMERDMPPRYSKLTLLASAVRLEFRPSASFVDRLVEVRFALGSGMNMGPICLGMGASMERIA